MAPLACPLPFNRTYDRGLPACSSALSRNHRGVDVRTAPWPPTRLPGQDTLAVFSHDACHTTCSLRGCPGEKPKRRKRASGRSKTARGKGPYGSTILSILTIPSFAASCRRSSSLTTPLCSHTGMPPPRHAGLRGACTAHIALPLPCRRASARTSRSAGGARELLRTGEPLAHTCWRQNGGACAPSESASVFGPADRVGCHCCCR
jgi:hypothetical protein